MGIYSRFKDIVNSNINSMLDNAEDPEKLIKLMIREMEDTLVEIKASCAGVMAAEKKIERQKTGANDKAVSWGERAKLAVDKGRDDLAKEALMEKRRFQQRAESLEKEVAEHAALILQYKDDISQLEDKLKSAREKQRILVQRHIHAKRKIKAQEDIRKIDTSDSVIKFDEFENRIERLEAEADLVNFGRKPHLEDEFDKLVVDEEIEKELEDLKVL